LWLAKNDVASTSEKRRDFFSVDIYKAVIKDVIESLNQFKEWLINKNGIKL
jgi:hypothetical protein